MSTRPLFNRRHYNAIASALRDVSDEHKLHVTAQLITLFKNDNLAFDAIKFMRAVSGKEHTDAV